MPSSASVLVRKDFVIRENLRKAPGGKKVESPTILGEEKKTKKKMMKRFFQEELLYCGEAFCRMSW